MHEQCDPGLTPSTARSGVCDCMGALACLFSTTSNVLTMVHVRLNERESNPNPHINFFTALPTADSAATEDARQLLRALAAQVRPIMKAHGFEVNSFEEVRNITRFCCSFIRSHTVHTQQGLCRAQLEQRRDHRYAQCHLHPCAVGTVLTLFRTCASQCAGPLSPNLVVA